MKLLAVYLLLLATTANGASLLEMSQTLWSKFLNGGLSNIGPFDPLRVPVIKVDQAEGKTSYRMILTNVEITGLNSSTLESIHVARGSVKANLSDHEAGYVSYSDKNALDGIRYRFHTVVKQPKSREDETLKVQSIETVQVTQRGQDDDGGNARRYGDQNQRQQDRYESESQRDNMRYAQYQNRPSQYQYQGTSTSTSTSTETPSEKNEKDHQAFFLVYAQTQKNAEDYRKSQENLPSDHHEDENRFEQRARVRFSSRGNIAANNKPCADYEGIKREDNRESARLEDRSDYVDIIYADENAHMLKHFGNLHIEGKNNKIVYNLDDVMKDLNNHRRFIIHNFTEIEALRKKNDPSRIVEDSKRIQDLIRYAKEFQEKQGYYEEGMELIYHYGDGNETKIFDGKRMKRADLNLKPENDDDIMHIILRIRVPLLYVKAGYVLMGKVGHQVLRESGRLHGNFTELIGDFTVEFKKTGEKSMIVRAARARLETKEKNVSLQGVNENQLVEEILTQGLMAAEAVAAMLADDLATKVLNETTADAMIYRMYKELPPN